jgi:hypothetical protein
MKCGPESVREMVDSVLRRAWLALRTVPKQYLPPALPVTALIVMPFLPFVNAPGLRLPRLMVWTVLWSLSWVPALVWSQRLMDRDEQRGRQ